MNVLIAGEDVVAFRIAEALMRHHHVVFLGPETADAPRLEKLDIQAVFGAVTSPEALESAQVRKADVFVAVTSSDEQNIVACLAAQRLGAKRTICILARPGFLSVGSDDDALAESLGIDMVVRPGTQLADEIIRIVTVPGALDVEVFADGRIRLLRFAVEENAPITRSPLRDLKLPGHVVLVMIRRGEEIIVPKGDTQLKAGDKVIAMGRWDAVRRLLLRFLRSEYHGADQHKAMVVGGGNVGVSVARGLRDAHWQVKLIESSRARCNEIAEQLDCLVLHGDGGDIDLLEQEGAAEMSVLVAVTDNDEKNLLISLLAKQLGTERIVTRADRLANERLFERVGVDVVRSAGGAAIRSVIRRVDHSESEIRAELEHGEACIIELELPASFNRIKLADLRPPEFARVATIVRGRSVIVPGGNDMLGAGDHLLIFCLRKDEDQTRAYFAEPPRLPETKA